MNDLLIEAYNSHRTWELTCINQHSFKIDLSTIDELELSLETQDQKEKTVWRGITCPECGTSEITKIKLPKY